MCEQCGTDCGGCCPVEIPKGDSGTSSVVYIAYATDSSGTGFSTTNGSLPYIGFIARDPSYTPIAADYAGLWYFRYNGVFGGNSDDFTFNTATSGDPTSGKLLINNANVSAATSINVSDTDASAADVTAWLAAIATSNATVKAFIRIGKKTDSTKFALYAVTALTSPSGYKTLTVTYLASSSNSPFASGDALVFSYCISGSNGNDGVTTLFNDLTQLNSGDTGGVTTTFETQNIPANTLVTNGDSVAIQVILQCLSTVFTNTVKTKINIGGNLTSLVAYSTTGQSVIADIRIDRISSTSYLLSGTQTDNLGSSIAATPVVITGANFAATIAVTVQANTNGDVGGITCRKNYGEYKNI